MTVARALGRETGTRVGIAGGAVRDLLLARPVTDVDLLVEGDAVAFARTLAGRLGAAETHVHPRFGTATLRLPGGESLDLAGTRTETYARPGALPRIEPGAAIEQDLARRDFPIHAMALELTPRRALIDPFGGRDDLARRRIRFLHAASPSDDPTRALRAVRYAARLGFSIAPEARRVIERARRSGAFDAVSGDRLRRELRLVVSEPARERSVSLLHARGLDRAVSPALGRAFPGAVSRIRAAARAAPRLTGTTWLCYLLAWMAHAPARDLEHVSQRLALSGTERETFGAWARARRRLTGLAALAALAPSRRRDRLAGVTPDQIVAAASMAGPRERRLLVAEAETPAAELSIRGSDLLAAGVTPGPAVGAALRAARTALRDGRIDRDGELAFALRAARRAERRR